MAELILVLTNTPSEAEAQAIAAAALEQRLAAAVQIIGPVKSAYRWQGRIEQAQEWICLLKSSRTHFEALERTIRSHHSYELPGILAIPVVAGSEAYLEWYAEQLD
jgi:periplasmic divalent cation tolerance protein